MNDSLTKELKRFMRTDDVSDGKILDGVKKEFTRVCGYPFEEVLNGRIYDDDKMITLFNRLTGSGIGKRLYPACDCDGIEYDKLAVQALVNIIQEKSSLSDLNKVKDVNQVSVSVFGKETYIESLPEFQDAINSIKWLKYELPYENHSRDFAEHIFFCQEMQNIQYAISDELHNDIDHEDYMNLPLRIYRSEDKYFRYPNVGEAIYKALYGKGQHNLRKIFRTYSQEDILTSDAVSVKFRYAEIFNVNKVSDGIREVFDCDKASLADWWIIRNSVDMDFIMETIYWFDRIKSKLKFLLIQTICKCHIPTMRVKIMRLIGPIIMALEKEGHLDKENIGACVWHIETVIDELNIAFRLFSDALLVKVQSKDYSLCELRLMDVPEWEQSIPCADEALIAKIIYVTITQLHNLLL